MKAAHRHGKALPSILLSPLSPLSLLVFLLLLLLPLPSSPHSTGAGHCVAPFSYTHGKTAHPGSGGFRVSISGGYGGDGSTFRPGDVVTVTVDSKKISGATPFRGLLLYASHGAFELPPHRDVLQFKESCDDQRGKGRTLTHVSNDPKESVSVELVLPGASDAAGREVLDDLGGKVVVNAIVMQELRQWYWLNRTLDGRPPPEPTAHRGHSTL
jgi:hypothetical protein